MVAESNVSFMELYNLEGSLLKYAVVWAEAFKVWSSWVYSQDSVDWGSVEKLHASVSTLSPMWQALFPSQVSVEE